MGRRGLGSGSGNYPPGAANDPRAPYNQPDRSHDHEWYPLEDTPLIEDGAAIFYEECQYAEGRYGDGWQCEETRSYRFEYDSLISPDGQEWLIPEITEDWSEVPDELEAAVIAVEVEGDLIGVDPDPEVGQVTLGFADWKLHFTA